MFWQPEHVTPVARKEKVDGGGQRNPKSVVRRRTADEADRSFFSILAFRFSRPGPGHPSGLA
jgi:hypothetical protein